MRRAWVIGGGLVTVSSPWWIPYTPLITVPLLGFAALGLGWVLIALVARTRLMRVSVAAGILAFAVFAVTTSRFAAPLVTPSFTSSPVAVEELVDLSRFRSCAGHDFSGSSVDEPSVSESDRSMIHYVSLATTYGSGDDVAIAALADGTITEADAGIDDPDDELANVGDFAGAVTLTIEPNALLGSWDVRYMNVHPTLSIGTRVHAGDVIATAPPRDWREVTWRDSPGSAAIDPDHPVQFALEVSHHPLVPTGELLASFVEMLGPTLQTEYADAGFAPADAVISRDQRDAEPCDGTYNDDPDADWVHGDAVRRAVDESAGDKGGVPPSDGTSTRPDCTEEHLDQTFTDDAGTWRCQWSAEGVLVWGPD